MSFSKVKHSLHREQRGSCHAGWHWEHECLKHSPAPILSFIEAVNELMATRGHDSNPRSFKEKILGPLNCLSTLQGVSGLWLL